MNKKMWFGIRGHMRWVPCPAVGAGYNRSGSGSTMNMLNGGAVSRLSMSGARSYSLSWSLGDVAELSKVIDYAEGVYGPGLVYWSDPFNMQTNVLSQVWATPSLGAHDGPILTGDASRPTLIATDANIYDLPPQSATYTVKPTSPVLKHWVPIPQGYTAWVGVYGDSSDGGGRVSIQPTGAGQPSGPPTHVLPIDGTEADRYPISVRSFDGHDGVELSLAGDGTITLAGLSVVIYPDGRTPTMGVFTPGRGHAGCNFVQHPSVTAHSAALGLQEMSAEFIEVGPWQL